jgi:phosphoserine phosphatase
MSEQDQNKVYKEFSSKKIEVSELKKRLNELDSSKEHWFKEKENVQLEVTSLISKVKELKKDRDILTNNVRKNKKERQDLNKIINEKIVLVKTLGKDIPTDFRSENPSKLKDEIKKLEFAIETQAISFDKEQKLMKEIKEKKKKLNEIDKKFSGQKEFRGVSKEIDDLKKKANFLHKEITKNAEDSQKKHEEMISISSKIDDLKKQEEEYHKKFLEFKQQFTDVNRELKTLLDGLSKMNEKISGHRMESARSKKKKVEQVLKNKEEAVEEKIKKGKKLTTEDLLVFQKSNSE